jgi:hypothetical protein
VVEKYRDLLSTEEVDEESEGPEFSDEESDEENVAYQDIFSCI